MAVDLDHIRAIADRVAAALGVEIVEIELRGAGKARMLRVFIDKPDGVTHEDCANLSREVGTILDVEDVIPGASYTLEVSSPGLDRKLSRPADFERFIGSLVKLTTHQPVNPPMSGLPVFRRAGCQLSPGGLPATRGSRLRGSERRSPTR